MAGPSGKWTQAPVRLHRLGRRPRTTGTVVQSGDLQPDRLDWCRPLRSACRPAGRPIL